MALIVDFEEQLKPRRLPMANSAEGGRIQTVVTNSLSCFCACTPHRFNFRQIVGQTKMVLSKKEFIDQNEVLSEKDALYAINQCQQTKTHGGLQPIGSYLANLF